MEFMKASFVISDRLIRTLIFPWLDLHGMNWIIVVNWSYLNCFELLSIWSHFQLWTGWWCQFDMILCLFLETKIYSAKGSHHIDWGYWNWLMLTKRLLNQLPSANTIHSILGSLYFGDVAYSNLWRQYLIWSINLANIIVTTLHSHTKHHQTIMLGSCNIADCMASIASCTHLTNIH